MSGPDGREGSHPRRRTSSPGPSTRPTGDALARALDEAAADAATKCRPPREAGLAVVAYAEGHLALAVAGVVGDCAGDRLLALLREVRSSARHALDVELSGLTRSSPALIRFLGYARLQQISGHGRLALHRPPTELVAALGEPGPDHVLVHGARPAVRAL